jgi:hypothetical protein
VQPRNQIGNDGAKSIAAALEGNSNLRELGLVRWSLGVLFLLNQLFSFDRVRWRLTCAVQRGNQIGDVGAKSIAAALEGNSNLEMLGLVRWRSLGFLLLLKMLFSFDRVRWRLTCAVQRDNLIGGDGAKSIAAALERNSSLKYLGLVRWSLWYLLLLKLRFVVSVVASILFLLLLPLMIFCFGSPGLFVSFPFTPSLTERQQHLCRGCLPPRRLHPAQPQSHRADPRPPALRLRQARRVAQWRAARGVTAARWSWMDSGAKGYAKGEHA